VAVGSKHFELRKNDRDYQEGDTLILNEWDPATGDFTGEFIEVLVTHILYGGQFGLATDHCCMSIETQRYGIAKRY
jgi:hypothetical protein